MKSVKISRRDILKVMAAITGGVGVAWLNRVFGVTADKLLDTNLSSRAYLPFIRKSDSTPASTSTQTPTATTTPSPTGIPGANPKVVHVHASHATSWDFSNGWYGDYVDQGVVDNMVDEGLKRLTGQSSIAAAWQALLPGYTTGKAIAVKVNFNNANSCSDSDNIIDALVEPVNALVRGMKIMGVREEDVWVYDAVRDLPNRFRNRSLYNKIHFFDAGCADEATFISNNPDAEVSFQNPSLQPRRITDVIINAAYLINMPIMKDHGISGVTLGFKNHLGTIDTVARAGDDNIHYFISPSDSHYLSSYNPLVDIYKNHHIRSKTALIVGDGLFAALGNTNVTPSQWQTFGNTAPNSLFFAVDPVAIDCVMKDILYAEPGYHPYKDTGHVGDYLRLAASAGLGVYEKGDPWGSGYTTINYQKIEL